MGDEDGAALNRPFGWSYRPQPAPTCATCRFWEPLVFETWSDDSESIEVSDPTTAPDSDLTHGVDVPAGKRWGTCGRQAEPQSPMFTVDGSHYFSALRTMADFGCATHALRAAAPPVEGDAE